MHPILVLCFLFYVSCFLAGCDSASLNQADANPFIICAAQFAEGSAPSTPQPANERREWGARPTAASAFPPPEPPTPAPITAPAALTPNSSLAALPPPKIKNQNSKTKNLITPW